MSSNATTKQQFLMCIFQKKGKLNTSEEKYSSSFKRKPFTSTAFYKARNNE